jgi:hypothetical protein
MSTHAPSKSHRTIQPPPTDDQIARFDRAFTAVLARAGGSHFSPTVLLKAFGAIRDGEVEITRQRVLSVPEQAAARITDSEYGSLARERYRIWNRLSGANGFMLNVEKTISNLEALAKGNLKVLRPAAI